MKRLFLFTILVAGMCSFISAAEKLSLDSLVTGVYDANAVSSFHPMNDPSLFVQRSGDATQLVSVDYRTGKQKEVLLDLKTIKGEGPTSIRGYLFNAAETKILIWATQAKIYRRSYLTEYYIFDRKRNYMEPLSTNGAQRDAKFSPDGRSVAFARANNLFIRRLDYGTEIQVTTDGSKDSILNGVTDWVYEEEFAATSAFDWSPDSKLLCYVKFDERAVPSFTLPVYGALTNTVKPMKYYPSFYRFKYPSSGELNSTASVWAFNLQTRSSKKMDVPMAEDDYIPRIRFTRNVNQLAVMVLNRAQNVFKMYFMNPKSAKGTLALSEQSETFVDPSFDDICFYTNYFTYLSEKDGYRHLYLYGPNGGLLKQLTSGKWEVTNFLGCDTLKNVFYYESNEQSVLRKDVWSIDQKGRKLLLTPEKGTNKVQFNADYSLFVKTWSDLNTPPVCTLMDLKMNKLVRVLEDNSAYRNAMKAFNLPDKQFITVPSADGQVLNGWMLKPRDFNATKKYPVVLVQYSGPSSQSVLDAYDMDWEYYLAQNQFIVVCVDGRGTGGRGTVFSHSTYTKLGVQEAEDQVAVASWLKTQPGVDGNRIGLWGWSYGGTIVLLGLSDASAVFKAGVAVAPVVDWRYYNTVYTERYMRTPNENMSGYNQTSPLERASKLKGRLLLISGMADDNVRSNQSMDFTEALIRAGVQFDMQVYPTSNHSILGATYRKHLYQRMFDFFKNNL